MLNRLYLLVVMRIKSLSSSFVFKKIKLIPKTAKSHSFDLTYNVLSFNVKSNARIIPLGKISNKRTEARTRPH